MVKKEQARSGAGSTKLATCRHFIYLFIFNSIVTQSLLFVETKTISKQLLKTIKMLKLK